jgi:hypothetical protein
MFVGCGPYIQGKVKLGLSVLEILHGQAHLADKIDGQPENIYNSFHYSGWRHNNNQDPRVMTLSFEKSTVKLVILALLPKS